MLDDDVLDHMLQGLESLSFGHTHAVHGDAVGLFYTHSGSFRRLYTRSSCAPCAISNDSLPADPESCSEVGMDFPEAGTSCNLTSFPDTGDGDCFVVQGVGFGLEFVVQGVGFSLEFVVVPGTGPVSMRTSVELC